METESLSAEQVVTEQSNWTLDFLGSIPTEIWVVVATAIVGLIGWFGKTAFDAWYKSRLPFKQDRDRYLAVIASVESQHFHYIKRTPLDSIGSRALDGIDDADESLSRIRTSNAAYLHKKLAELENALFVRVRELADFLPLQLYPHRFSANMFTMYWDNFDQRDAEQLQRATAKETEIRSKIDAVISAFEAYRDYGNKLFADRLVKEKSNG